MPTIPDNYAANDKTRAQQLDYFEPNSSGMVLVVVIILAAVAGILAVGLNFAGGSKITQGRREMRFEKAFFVAEAGIEHAKNELRYNAANLNGILTNGGVLFGGVTNYGEGGFYVWVRNNTNSDPNPFVDTDRIVIVRSTGIVETATRVIEVQVQVTNIPPQGADGALSIYGTNTDLTVTGNGKIDGNDWDLPAAFDCVGAGCDGTLSTNEAVPGVLTTDPSTTITTNQGDSIVGDPPTTNGVGMYDETYWYQFLDKMIALATTYTPGGSLGTRDAPAITMLPMGATTINPSDKVAGAGILIIPGDASFSIKGTFHFEGLVILVGNGIIDVDSEFVGTGTARIFGAMVCVGGALDLVATGTADIKYSTEALDNLKNLQVPFPIDILYWKEIKASSTDW